MRKLSESMARVCAKLGKFCMVLLALNGALAVESAWTLAATIDDLRREICGPSGKIPPCPRCEEAPEVQKMLDDPSKYDCYHVRCSLANKCREWAAPYQDFCSQTAAAQLEICRIEKQDACIIDAFAEALTATGGELPENWEGAMDDTKKNAALKIIQSYFADMGKRLFPELCSRLGPLGMIFTIGDGTIQAAALANIVNNFTSCMTSARDRCKQEAFDQVYSRVLRLRNEAKDICNRPRYKKNGEKEKSVACKEKPGPDNRRIVIYEAPHEACACPITPEDRTAGFDLIDEDEALGDLEGRVVEVCCQEGSSQCAKSRCTLRDQFGCEKEKGFPSVYWSGYKYKQCEWRYYPGTR